MNEAETRAELIDPALKEVGWGTDSSAICIEGTALTAPLATLPAFRHNGRHGQIQDFPGRSHA